MKPLYRHLLFFVLTFTFFTAVAQQGIDKPRYQILTKRAGNYLGTFNIELFPLIAPLATHNFDSLATALAFDSTAFHRVVPGFVIQGGDPNSINGPISTWGQGNANQPTVPAEFSPVHQFRGIIGAARDADPNSANSQFYICVANATSLDGNYTVFGKVTDSMQVVDTIVNAPRDVNDVPLQKIEMFVTYLGVNDTVPPAPTLVAPANAATAIYGNQVFQWTAAYSAQLYRLEFSLDPNFPTIDVFKDAPDLTTTVPNLIGDTTYYWRVRTNNGGHYSFPSNVYSFTTAVSAPELVSPADSSTNNFVNPTLIWTAAHSATSYTLQVANNLSFAGPYLVFNQSGITGTFQQISGLNPNTLYFWRMKSTDGVTTSVYSAKHRFTTGTATGIPEISEGKNIAINRIFPNPASGVLNLEIGVRSATTVTVILQDLAGKQVYNTSQKAGKSGLALSLDVSNFPKGIYLVIVRNGADEAVQKVEIR
jgi:peptidyl-prolyl cis-trans isomerase B (cyclophilin B)